MLDLFYSNLCSDQRQKETITPGTTQPEVFNILGQLEALEKGLKENTLSLDSKKTKKLK